MTSVRVHRAKLFYSADSTWVFPISKPILRLLLLLLWLRLHPATVRTPFRGKLFQRKKCCVHAHGAAWFDWHGRRRRRSSREKSGAIDPNIFLAVILISAGCESANGPATLSGNLSTCPDYRRPAGSLINNPSNAEATFVQIIFENHLNPVMLVFIGKLLLSTLI